MKKFCPRTAENPRTYPRHLISCRGKGHDEGTDVTVLVAVLVIGALALRTRQN